MNSGQTKRLLTAQERVQKVVDAISKLKPGTMVPWSDLLLWFETTDKWLVYRHMAAVKQLLEESHGFFLQAIHASGYLIKPRGEEINLVRVTIAKGLRTCARGVHSAALIRTEMIADSKERNATIKAVAKLNGLKLLSLQGDI